MAGHWLSIGCGWHWLSTCTLGGHWLSIDMRIGLSLAGASYGYIINPSVGCMRIAIWLQS